MLLLFFKKQHIFNLHNNYEYDKQQSLTMSIHA